MQAAAQDQIPFSKHWLEQLFKERTVQRGEDYHVIGYDVVSGVPVRNISIAKATISQSLRTPGNDGLDQIISRLWFATQSENLGDKERALKFQVYKEALVDYPKDLLEEFSKTWPPTHKFFPKIAEIIEVIKPEHQQRLMQLKALDEAIERDRTTKIGQSEKLGDLQTTWIKTKEHLREHWDAFMVRQWFNPLVVSNKESCKVTLRANSSFEREWVSTKYLDKLLNAWQKFDPATTQIEVTL